LFTDFVDRKCTGSAGNPSKFPKFF
jgi:hypothetical protein